MLLIISESEWIDATLLCFKDRGDMLLFSHTYIVVSGTDFFPEGFFRFGVDISDDEEITVGFFISEEKIFDKWCFF